MSQEAIQGVGDARTQLSALGFDCGTTPGAKLLEAQTRLQQMEGLDLSVCLTPPK